MLDYFYYLLFGAVIIISSLLYLKIKKDKKSIIENEKNIDEILSLMKKDNIENLEFIRNKIVVTFKDVTKFDVKKLHENGVKGINIIGDKVKFYIDEDKLENERTFLIIKKHIDNK